MDAYGNEKTGVVMLDISAESHFKNDRGQLFVQTTAADIDRAHKDVFPGRKEAFAAFGFTVTDGSAALAPHPAYVTNLPPELIEDDESAQGEKEFTMVNATLLSRILGNIGPTVISRYAKGNLPDKYVPFGIPFPVYKVKGHWPSYDVDHVREWMRQVGYGQ